ADDVARSRIAFAIVVNVNDASVEWDYVAHLVDENLERVFHVQRRSKRARNLVQRINFAMCFFDLVVSNERTALASLGHVDRAELNWFSRTVCWLMLQPKPFDLGIKSRQMFDELLDDHRIEVNTRAAQQQRRRFVQRHAATERSIFPN